MNENGKADLNAKPALECSPALRTPHEVNCENSDARLFTAETLTGTRVANPRGETLGTLRDIVLDVERGSIAGAVMASGGFMGVGERLFALPWKALTADTERHCYVLDADPADFENSPGVDLKCWRESPFAHRED